MGSIPVAVSGMTICQLCNFEFNVLDTKEAWKAYPSRKPNSLSTQKSIFFLRESSGWGCTFGLLRPWIPNSRPYHWATCTYNMDTKLAQKVKPVPGTNLCFTETAAAATTAMACDRRNLFFASNLIFSYKHHKTWNFALFLRGKWKTGIFRWILK
jgi:hypothetical protein